MNSSLPENNEKDQSQTSGPLSLADNFNKYFRVQVADKRELRHEAFKIRHQVYCKELGWETQRDSGMETDEFDNYSYHCLLEHSATSTYAGCIRIVIPPPNNLTIVTPFETHFLSSVRPEIVDLGMLNRGSYGEISRIAVPDTFRRRPNETKQPFIINDIGDSHVFTEEERRNFPNIAVGLYLTALALLKVCRHKAAFVMMEPKLHRRLNRFGFPFVQAGDVVDYHGLRALFYLPADNYFSGLNPELLQLFEGILQQVKQQINLLPYTDPTDR